MITICYKSDVLYNICLCIMSSSCKKYGKLQQEDLSSKVKKFETLHYMLIYIQIYLCVCFCMQ